MPKIMFFNEPKVRNRVLSCQDTITIRTKPTNELREVVHGGYYKNIRTGHVISTNIIWESVGLDKTALEEFLPMSGFDTVNQWIDAINRQHKPKSNQKFYFIEVTSQSCHKA